MRANVAPILEGWKKMALWVCELTRELGAGRGEVRFDCCGMDLSGTFPFRESLPSAFRSAVSSVVVA